MVNILGANSVSGGYEIDNSLRFNDNDSAKLSRTPSSAGNRQTWTVSVWVKRANITTGQGIFSTYSGNANINTQSAFQSNDKLNFYDATSAYQWRFVTNQLFRDPSAWYNLCYVSDTTQSTAGDRIKLYINGSRVTSFEVALNPDQNNNTADWNADVLHNIGEHNGEFFDGYMAEFHNIDGQALTPSDFGETDDNGVWIPKAYTGSYGTNGFYLEFKQTGTGTDNDIALSEGNTKSVITNNWKYTPTTMAAANGKWYAEVTAIDAANFQVGFIALGGDSDRTSIMNTNNTMIGTYADGWGMFSPSYSNTGYKNNNNNTTAISGTTIANDDIIMLAMDLDNQKIYFGLNGTFLNSGNPANQTNPAFTNLTANLFYAFASGGENCTNLWNFGNPAYAVSSSNADANGYGNFEYTPPSGYYSLCTKNLAEFG